MSQEMIKQMVAAVEEGYSPRSVWETSLTFAPGATVKVNKATTGTDPQTGASVSIPEGEVVSILGIGGGPSGTDHHVLLKDGRQAIVPFYDLGEATLLRRAPYDQAIYESDLIGVVSKITLAKPLPQSTVDWLAGGHQDYGVELPYSPQADSGTAITFLMKADDQEMLDAAIEALKKVAGASYKSSTSASLTDWAKA